MSSVAQVGSSCYMTFKLLHRIGARPHDLPKYRLRRGDLARLVEHHVSPKGEEGDSAEVLGAKGQTLAVIAVSVASMEALRRRGLLGVRAISA